MGKIKANILQQNYYALVNGKLKDPSPKKITRNIIGHAGDKPASISGLTYVGGKLVSGAASILEGTTDLIGGIFGGKEYREYVHIYDNWTQDFNDALDKAYDPGKVGRFVGDVASGVGQSSAFLIPYVGQFVFFTGVMGNSVSEAAQKTGKVGAREYVYGAGSAAMEWALERWVGAAGQGLDSITKSGAKNLGSKFTKKNVQNLIDTSEVLFTETNKNRFENWLKVNRLQLPLPSTDSKSVYNNSITQKGEKSNALAEKNVSEEDIST